MSVEDPSSKIDGRLSLRTVGLLLDIGDIPEGRQAEVNSRVSGAEKSAVSRKVTQMAKQTVDVLRNETTQLLVHTTTHLDSEDATYAHALMRPKSGDGGQSYVAHCTHADADALIDVASQVADERVMSAVRGQLEKDLTIQAKVTFALVALDGTDKDALHSGLLNVYSKRFGEHLRSIPGPDDEEGVYLHTRYLLQSLVVVRVSVVEGNVRVVSAVLIFGGMLTAFFGEALEDEEMNRLRVAAKLARRSLDRGQSMVSLFCPKQDKYNTDVYTRAELLKCKEIGVQAQIGVEDAKPLSVVDRMSVATEHAALYGAQEPWKEGRVNPDTFARETLKSNYDALSPAHVQPKSLESRSCNSFGGIRAEVDRCARDLLCHRVYLHQPEDRQEYVNELPSPIKEKVIKKLESGKANAGWRRVPPKMMHKSETLVHKCLIIAAYYVQPISLSGRNAQEFFKLIDSVKSPVGRSLDAQLDDMLEFSYELIDYIYIPSSVLWHTFQELDDPKKDVTCQQARSVWKKMMRDYSLVRILVDYYAEDTIKHRSPFASMTPDHPDSRCHELNLAGFCDIMRDHLRSGTVHLDQSVGSSGTYKMMDNRDYYYPKFDLDDFVPSVGIEGRDGNHISLAVLMRMTDHNEWCGLLHGVDRPADSQNDTGGNSSHTDDYSFFDAEQGNDADSKSPNGANLGAVTQSPVLLVAEKCDVDEVADVSSNAEKMASRDGTRHGASVPSPAILLKGKGDATSTGASERADQIGTQVDSDRESGIQPPGLCSGIVALIQTTNSDVNPALRNTDTVQLTHTRMNEDSLVSPHSPKVGGDELEAARVVDVSTSTKEIPKFTPTSHDKPGAPGLLGNLLLGVKSRLGFASPPIHGPDNRDSDSDFGEGGDNTGDLDVDEDDKDVYEKKGTNTADPVSHADADSPRVHFDKKLVTPEDTDAPHGGQQLGAPPPPLHSVKETPMRNNPHSKDSIPLMLTADEFSAFTRDDSGGMEGKQATKDMEINRVAESNHTATTPTENPVDGGAGKAMDNMPIAGGVGRVNDDLPVCQKIGEKAEDKKPPASDDGEGRDDTSGAQTVDVANAPGNNSSDDAGHNEDAKIQPTAIEGEDGGGDVIAPEEETVRGLEDDLGEANAPGEGGENGNVAGIDVTDEGELCTPPAKKLRRSARKSRPPHDPYTIDSETFRYRGKRKGRPTRSGCSGQGATKKPKNVNALEKVGVVAHWVGEESDEMFGTLQECFGSAANKEEFYDYAMAVVDSGQMEFKAEKRSR